MPIHYLVNYKLFFIAFVLFFSGSAYAVDGPKHKATYVTYGDQLAVSLVNRNYTAPFREERKWWQNFYSDAYTIDRQIIQDQIITSLLPDGSKSESPWVILMAGGFGSGKTVASKEIEKIFPEKLKFGRIEADQFREAIPEYQEYLKDDPKWAAKLVHQEATYLADLAAMRGLQQNQNLIIDSSLKSYEDSAKIVAWIKKHHPRYRIMIAHVSADRNLVIKQFNDRAKEIGRDTSESDIDPSITGSKETVEKLVPSVDHVFVIENDGENFTLEKILKKNGTIRLKWSLSEPNFKKALELSISRNPKETIFRNVYDIDWTLMSSLKHSSGYPITESWQVVIAEGDRYRISDYIDELVQYYLKDPHLRFCVWSKGTKSRNIQLLKAIKPPSLKGRSLYDFAEIVLSEEDLNQKGEKELKKITDDVAHVYLSDDQAKNVQGSGEHGVTLPQTYNYFETYQQVEAARQEANNLHQSSQFIPPSYEEWIRDRDRLLGLLEIADHSKKEMLRLKISGNRKLHYGEIAENYVQTEWKTLNDRGFELISGEPMSTKCPHWMAGE